MCSSADGVKVERKALAYQASASPTPLHHAAESRHNPSKMSAGVIVKLLRLSLLTLLTSSSSPAAVAREPNPLRSRPALSKTASTQTQCSLSSRT